MWGDQTWEEMAVAFFDVARPLQESPITSQAKPEPAAVSVPDDLRLRREKFVNDFFAEMDTDKDGQVRREELPKALRRFGYWQFDVDGNGVISREDIQQLAEYRIH